MDLTRKQVIKNLNALNAVCGQKDFYDKEMKESMRYAISSLETDEAYQIMYEGREVFTKADMIAMLEEIRLVATKMKDSQANTGFWEDYDFIVKRRIDKLKGEETDGN